MANTIQLKRGTGSSVPSSLAEGELAINLDSGKLFYGSGSSVLSSYTFTDITASGAISASGTVTGLTGSFNQLSVLSSGDTGTPPLEGHLLRITDTTNGNPDIDHFFVENDALTYGMRWHYDGGDNDFGLYRHNNSSAGVKILNFSRTSNTSTFYGDVYLDSTSKLYANNTQIVYGDGSGVIIGQSNRPLTLDGTALNINSDITASGNISASAYVYADRVFLQNNDVLRYSSANSGLYVNGGIQTIGNSSIGIAASNTHTIIGHITASGNISASGDIIASTLTGKFKHRDLQLGRQTNNSNDNANGDIIYWDVSQGTTQGNIYSLCDGTWLLAGNAGSVSTGSLAIAMGDDAQEGMCVRGLVYMAASYSTTAKGAPVYLGTTAGRLTNAVSTTSGKINRIVGYHMSGSQTIYFNPDNTWIEVS